MSTPVSYTHLDVYKRQDMDGALRLMKDFLSTVPYCDNTKYEGHYQQLLYIMFSLLTNYRMQLSLIHI